MESTQRQAPFTGRGLQPATQESGTWTRSRAGVVLFGAAPQLREPGEAELGEVTDRRVSCAGTPRTYPIFKAIGTDDPVAALDRAETRAVEMLTGVIDELSRIQREVRDGATPAPPLFSKELAHAMRTRLRLDVTKRQVWTGKGPGTAEIIVRWYSNVRKIATAVNYVCLGKDCKKEWAHVFPTTRPRTIFLCRPFWAASLDNQALTIIHELAHLYYGLEETGGGAGNVNCLEQFVADFHGVTILPGFIRACRPPAR